MKMIDYIVDKHHIDIDTGYIKRAKVSGFYFFGFNVIFT